MAPKRKKGKGKGKQDPSNGVSNVFGEEGLSKPHSAEATVGDRQKWQGFCEIESDPVFESGISFRLNMLTQVQAFFNVMLKEMGAKGVKVKEVFSLDAEALALLP